MHQSLDPLRKELSGLVMEPLLHRGLDEHYYTLSETYLGAPYHQHQHYLSIRLVQAGIKWLGSPYGRPRSRQMNLLPQGCLLDT
jgi:hypothetical protein